MYLFIRHPNRHKLSYAGRIKQGVMNTTFGKLVNVKADKILNLTFEFLKVFLLFPFISVTETASCTLT